MEFALGNKLFEKGCVTVDGRMDEPVWAEAEEFTGFRRPEAQGAVLADRQTSFKILPCADRLYIGIRCEDYLSVTQMIERILDVESLDEIEELLVLVQDVLVESAGVETLSAQEEHRLVHGVTGVSERTSCGLTLRQEDHRILAIPLLARLFLAVEMEMVLAVLELRNAYAHRLAALAGLLLDSIELTAQL